MSNLTSAQEEGLDIARRMVKAGIPVFIAARNHGPGPEFFYPKGWEQTRRNLDVIDHWRPGMALCAVTGVVADVLDSDPRNGGEASRADLIQAGVWPRVYGTVVTPGGGLHEYITCTRVAKASPAAGIDLQAGDPDGAGRGFVFLPPTERLAKGGDRGGQIVAYAWQEDPDLDWLADWGEEGDGTQEAIANLVRQGRARRAPVRAAAASAGAGEDDPFDTVYSAWDTNAAGRVIKGQLCAVEAARDGQVNAVLGGAARLLGRFVGGGFLPEEEAVSGLLAALARGGVHSDGWNLAHGRSWTAGSVIAAGLERGRTEPWEVMTAATPPAGGSAPAPATAPGATPPLYVTSGADMTYWLQSALGSGSLSGFFSRMGQVVHTPRVNELGYVPPRDEHDENGPAVIAAVTPGQLAAKIQYAHYCYKEVDVKDEAGKKTGEKRQVPALFPVEAARRATDAPEAMAALRSLRGVTHTPMVRADGSILDAPGYDQASGYLFLPGPGVAVAAVPEAPTAADVARALALLDEMVAGFPWETPADRANYLGLLLTPLMRLITPPSYKAFFIGAHQPGSGKTLLADVARILHGGILRSEMPMDEAEIKKMTTSMLATTSAPVVHVDNVTGVLRSSTLAGLLTSSGELSDRELGKTSNVTFTNDRTWIFTGNNPSLGGDMVRRTIVVMIDPNMANPESRQFAIKDLPAWVGEHRNQLLHALLVLMRNWVAQGQRPAARAQSDSFATWESALAGVLAAAGVVGEFDAQSGARAASGGDDDGLASLLEHVHASYEDTPWSVAQLLTAEPDEFRADAREWLPTPILEKMERSEVGGRKSLGRWLMNRAGRWVSSDDGTAYVLREAGRNRAKVALWKVEQRVR